MVTAEEILELLRRATTRSCRAAQPGTRAGRGVRRRSTDRAARAGPSRPGRVGIIASVTRPFCRDCDRLRLTADGQLRTCLFAAGRDRPARPAARRRVRRRARRRDHRTAVAGKQAGHGIGAAASSSPALDVRHRRLTARPALSLGAELGRPQRAAQQEAAAVQEPARWSAWSSQASQCLTRVASCSRGLRHCRSTVACARQPFAEQRGGRPVACTARHPGTVQGRHVP